MSPTATREQIRDAYRSLAREAHPDVVRATGVKQPVSMTELNQAWRVLGESSRRAEYDRWLGVAGSAETGPADAEPTAATRSAPAPLPPARVPWRLFIGLAVAGALAVLLAHAFTDPPPPAQVDNLLRPGDCVSIDTNQDAREVACSDPKARWVVVSLIPHAATCPTGTEAHRDRQGMGIACVRPR